MTVLVVGKNATFAYERESEIPEHYRKRGSPIIRDDEPLQSIYEQCVGADPTGRLHALKIARLYELLPSWCIFQTDHSVVVFVSQGFESMWCEELLFAGNDLVRDVPSLIEMVATGRAGIGDLRQSTEDFGPYPSREAMREAFHDFYRASTPTMIASSSDDERCFRVWPSREAAALLGATITMLGETLEAESYPA